MTNTNRIKSLMALNGETQKDLSKVLGISTQSISLKLLGKRDFKLSELQKLSSHYKKAVSYFIN